jgi:hypothetical protein
MKRLRQWVGLLLLVLWVPLTSHCAWENLPGMQFFKCATASEDTCAADAPLPPPSDCDGDACSQVESPIYKASDPQARLLMPVAMVVFELPSPVEETQASSLPATRAPAAIPWQFSFRTALLPRAPSSAS